MVSVDAPAGNRVIFASDGKLLDSWYPKSITELLGKEAFLIRPHEEHRQNARIHMLFDLFFRKPICTQKHQLNCKYK